MQLSSLGPATLVPLEGPGKRVLGGINLPSLTGLRFVAATMVLVHHAAMVGQVPFLSPWHGFGTTGVSFFFVLSGFVLTWSAPESEKISDFYVRRVFRIWPLMFLSVLLAIPVFYSGRDVPVDVAALLLQIFALQAWFNSSKIYFGGNPANWSLSNEAFFYLAHPFIARAIKRMKTPLLGMSFFLVASIQIVLAYCAYNFFYPERAWLTYIFPGFRIFEFILGMLAARYILSGGTFFNKFGSLGFGLALIFCWFYVQFTISPELSRGGRNAVLYMRYAATPLIYTYIIASAASLDIRNGGTLLSGRVIVKLGHWSFAMYLIHATLIYAYKQNFGVLRPDNSNLLLYVAILIFSVVGAAVLHELVEAPLNNRLRAWWRIRKSRADGPTHRDGIDLPIDASIVKSQVQPEEGERAAR